MRLFLPLFAILLTSCSLTPDYERPVIEMPYDWASKGAVSLVENTENLSTHNQGDWWARFNSNELYAFIGSGLDNNNNIKAGYERIIQARANVRANQASLFPQIGGTAGANKSFLNPAHGTNTDTTSYRAGADISYELDIFGANRANVDATRAQLHSQEYAQESLLIITAADIAGNYFTLLNLRDRLTVSENNLKNANEVLRIIKARVREGVETDIVLSQQEMSVSNIRAAQENLHLQIYNYENSLGVLLGRAPQSVIVEANNLTGIDIPYINASQPSKLLERRPDIKSAEQLLIAANANIGAARAAFYPQISLGAGISAVTANLSDPLSTTTTLASTLTAPIFQGGRLQANLDSAVSKQNELIHTYRQTILTAFREVEDALESVRTANEREKILLKSQTEANKAYRLTKKLYDEGAIDYQSLLIAQTAQLNAQDSYTQGRLAQLEAVLILYKALGGAWI
jgi:multidrug efflux system outer membrane protein